MGISFLLLIHFIYSDLMVFCDSINLKVPSIFFLYADFTSFFVYLLKIKSNSTLYFKRLFLSIDILFSLYR